MQKQATYRLFAYASALHSLKEWKGPKTRKKFAIVPDAVAARQTPTTVRAATHTEATRPQHSASFISENSAITGAASASRAEPKNKEQPVARIAQDDGQPHQKQSAP